MSALDVMVSRHISAGDRLVTVPVRSSLFGHPIITNRTVIMDSNNHSKGILPTSFRRNI